MTWACITRRALGLTVIVIGSLVLSVGTGMAEAPRLRMLGCGRLGAPPAAEVCVPVEIETRGARVASVALVIEYDARVLRLANDVADVRAGAALAAGQSVALVTMDGGVSSRVSVMVTPPPQFPIAVIGDGELVRICFTVRDGAPSGCSHLRFIGGSTDMGNDKGINLAVAPAVDGGVRVQFGGREAGR